MRSSIPTLVLLRSFRQYFTDTAVMTSTAARRIVVVPGPAQTAWPETGTTEESPTRIVRRPVKVPAVEVMSISVDAAFARVTTFDAGTTPVCVNGGLKQEAEDLSELHLTTDVDDLL